MHVDQSLKYLSQCKLVYLQSCTKIVKIKKGFKKQTFRKSSKQNYQWCFKSKKKHRYCQSGSTFRRRSHSANHSLGNLFILLTKLLLLLSFSFKEENIKELLLLLILGIYSLYLVMLIRNLIFVYLSQRKYHFIKIQLDSDSICKVYRITAVWTQAALFCFHYLNKSNHNKQSNEKFINLWGGCRLAFWVAFC